MLTRYYSCEGSSSLIVSIHVQDLFIAEWVGVARAKFAADITFVWLMNDEVISKLI